MPEFDGNVWNIPTGELQILSNQVHIWKADVHSFQRSLDFLTPWLSEEETQRGQRYLAADVRDRFLTARGLLRGILAIYTSYAPADIQFAASLHGKPYLSFPGQAGLEFSLSHSSGIILVAVTSGLPVGIDVETMQQEIDLGLISSKYFSELENQSIHDLPQTLQKQAFFNCWTRKEAYLKGLGVGLTAPLHDFSVTVAPHEPARLINTLPGDCEGGAWQIVAIEPGPGYAAAAAVQSVQNLDLVFWQAAPDWLRNRFN
jgi:4'-phosphopantetheinyl transferase